MISAEEIGKRIKMLRKQKHVSQEKMAEDLFMYQADVSNLEHGKSGSGIDSLQKLNLIADYFDVPFIWLLTGADEIRAAVSENKKSEGITMNDYTITGLKNWMNEYEERYVGEVTLTAPDGTVVFVTSENKERENTWIYKSDVSLLDILEKSRRTKEQKDTLKKYCRIKGSSLYDIFRTVPQDMLKTVRLSIGILWEEEPDKGLIGKKLSEVANEPLDWEAESLIDIDFDDLAIVYRYRLMTEAYMKNPSIYDDIAGADVEEQNKVILEKLKAACHDESAYKVWKKDIVNERIKEIKEKLHLVTCEYFFAGFGSYTKTIPIEEMECFKLDVDSNGGGWFTGYHEATEKEIRQFAKEHILDDKIFVPNEEKCKECAMRDRKALAQEKEEK